MRPHRRQFVLGPRAVRPSPDWVTEELPGVGRLSHSPDLPVASGADAGGGAVRLLGWAVQTIPGAPAPAATPLAGDLPSAYHAWGGRWALIGGGELHPDAAALLGCFYGREPESGALWVSSSIPLLKQFVAPDAAPTRALRHAVGVSWYTPPHTRYAPIRQLLPTQVLDLSSGEVRPRPLATPSPNPSYARTLDELQEYLVEGIRQVAQGARRVWLPLTAGKDSRTLLAAALAAGVEVRTYTHADASVSRLEVLTAAAVARAAGVPHAVRRNGAFREALAAIYDEHTGGQSEHPVRDQLARGGFDWCEPGDAILRSQTHPIGVPGTWHGRLPELGGPIPPDARAILRGFERHGYVAEDAVVRGIEEWAAWATATPQEGVDWRDRFYVEQRVTGWAGALQQGLDLVDAVGAHVPNSHRFYSLALQIPAEGRRRKVHHTDLIGRMAPRLNRIPFNPQQSGRFRAARRVAGPVRSLLGRAIRRRG